MSIHLSYQKWYSKTLPVIKQLLPDRYREFQEQYKLDKRKEYNALTYTISDYLLGIQIKRKKTIYTTEKVVDPFTVFFTKLQHQIAILNSACDRVDSILTDIEGVVKAELFDSEISASEELLKKRHLRSAGALAGVTLEAHLSKVTRSHGITFRKQSLSIADYNQALKDQNIIDLPTWRFIQHLGDIRNLCVHARDREPEYGEVGDLIKGVRKIIRTVF